MDNNTMVVLVVLIVAIVAIFAITVWMYYYTPYLGGYHHMDNISHMMRGY